MKVRRDAWFSDIFGYDVFEVILYESSSTEDWPSACKDLLSTSQSSSAFYYVKVPTPRVDVVRTLTSIGFHVIDTDITFTRRSGMIEEEADERPAVGVDILPEHHEAVLAIASSCFRYSRFHLDPYIPDQLANSIKRAWVDNYIRRGRGERLLIGLFDNEPVGFLAILTADLNSEPTLVIDLVGVDRAYQRRGVGKSLVRYFVNDLSQRNCLLRVGTQTANIPSIRLYESMGFRMIEAQYVLHAHVRDGKLQK